MTTATSSTASIALSAQTSLGASQAPLTACAAFMRDYRHEGATVSEMQTYASCVGRVHPQPIGGDVLAFGQIAALLVLAFLVGGALVELRVRSAGLGVLGSLAAGAAIGLGVGLGLSTLIGIVWLCVRVLLG